MRNRREIYYNPDYRPSRDDYDSERRRDLARRQAAIYDEDERERYRDERRYAAAPPRDWPGDADDWDRFRRQARSEAWEVPPPGYGREARDHGYEYGADDVRGGNSYRRSEGPRAYRSHEPRHHGRAHYWTDRFDRGHWGTGREYYDRARYDVRDISDRDYDPDDYRARQRDFFSRQREPEWNERNRFRGRRR